MCVQRVRDSSGGRDGWRYSFDLTGRAGTCSRRWKLAEGLDGMGTQIPDYGPGVEVWRRLLDDVLEEG
jgi:hypothetical protein